MMWFKKKPESRLTSLDGFTLGQIVRHRIGDRFNRAVIVRLFTEPDGEPWATVARGDFGSDEIDVHLCEIQDASSATEDARG